MKLTPLTLLLLTALVPFVVRAEPSLRDIIDASVARDPDQSLAGAIRAEGRALQRQSSSLFAADPALTLRHETDAIDTNAGYRYWEGGLAMPVWLPGQRANRRLVATATEEEAAAQEWMLRWRVAGTVREWLWSLRIAEAEWQLAQQAVASARSLQTDVEHRLQAGELARTDLILAQKETLARELELTAANSHHQSLLQRYQMLTGQTELPCLEEESRAADRDIGSGHPVLAAAEVAIARARAERNQIRDEKRANPVVSIGAISERAQQGFSTDQSLALEINLPLGMASQAAPRTAAAERALTESTNTLLRLQRELEQALIQANSERARADQSLRLAQEQQRLAAEGLRLNQRAFELGEGDLFTLLQARAQALAAAREVELQRLAHGRAIARYNQALGVIPE
ncbi:MAG: TolC family protein [Gammaproteobacteria bacterium]|nr:TolC family protein [Gammaproteobacteria bacterium]